MKATAAALAVMAGTASAIICRQGFYYAGCTYLLDGDYTSTYDCGEGYDACYSSEDSTGGCTAWLGGCATTASCDSTSVSASYYYSYLGLSYTYYDNCCYSDDCNSAATTAVATAAVAAAVIAYAW